MPHKFQSTFLHSFAILKIDLDIPSQCMVSQDTIDIKMTMILII